MIWFFFAGFIAGVVGTVMASKWLVESGRVYFEDADESDESEEDECPDRDQGDVD